MCGRTIFCLLLFLAPLCADHIDEIIRGEMDRQRIPGLALAIVRDGQPPRLQGYGIANIEQNIAVTPQTVFKIGSVSKQFIAAGVLLLAADGKLSLNDSIRKHLDDAPAEWESVTLRHALSHTGGLIREGSTFNSFRAKPDMDVIRSAYALPLVFKAGERWQYSNIGYFAMAEVIHRVSGKPWDEFIAERIFTPVGMKASRATSTSQLVLNRAGCYELHDGQFRNAVDFIAVRPSGAFLSTAEDLAKWDSALYSDVPLRKNLREAMWSAVMLTDGKSSRYGLGWHVGQRNGKRVVSHGGTLSGSKSHYIRFPDDRVSIIVLTNLGSAVPDEITAKLANAILASGLLTTGAR